MSITIALAPTPNWHAQIGKLACMLAKNSFTVVYVNIGQYSLPHALTFPNSRMVTYRDAIHDPPTELIFLPAAPRDMIALMVDPFAHAYLSKMREAGVKMAVFDAVAELLWNSKFIIYPYVSQFLIQNAVCLNVYVEEVLNTLNPISIKQDLYVR